jgi:cytochrome oxidase Cu insertion factor (SCO1/SenC/PrrC family)
MGARRHRPLHVLALLLSVCAGACSDGVAARGGVLGEETALAARADDPRAFGEVPDFALVSQTGEPVTLDTLRGRPFAVAAIFTTCSGPCPKITASMRRLQDVLAEADVRLVSVSVDPETDTPEVLAAYADAYTADGERWLFLTGEEEEIHGFLREGLWLPLARAAEGEAEPGQEVTHSTKIVAVDRTGRLRGWYEGVDAAEVDRLAERLAFLAAE